MGQKRRRDDCICIKYWLTSLSTTDAVTARDFAQLTPRRARQFRRYLYKKTKYRVNAY